MHVLSYTVINYDPQQQGPMKIIVNIDGCAHAHLDRRDAADQGNVPETPPTCDASTTHRLQDHIDKLAISE